MMGKVSNMKIPMTDTCGRCQDRAKFNDVVFHDDIIAAEYICDCGYVHRNLLTKVEFIHPEKNNCLNCGSNAFGYCYSYKHNKLTTVDLYCDDHRRK